MLVLLTRQHISRGGRQNLFKTVEKCVHRKVPLPILLGPHFSTTASFASSSDGSSDGKTSKTPAAEQARQRLQEKEEDRLFHSEVERIRAQVIQEMEGSKSTTAMSSNRSKGLSKSLWVTWKMVAFFGTGCAVIYAIFLILWHRREKQTLTPNTMYPVKPEQLGLPPQPDVWKDFGGDWELTNCETGEVESSEQFRGSYVLLYWGYTNCPDICWEELEKITKVVTELQTTDQLPIVPVFLSIDPYRDSADKVRKYLGGISPLLKGFTGTPEQIRAASRKYRIYYMVSGKDKAVGSDTEEDDYLVDHSMRSYLIGPDGKFLKMFVRLENGKDIVRQIREVACVTQSGSVKETLAEYWRTLFN